MLPPLEGDQSAHGRPTEIEYRMARQAHGMGGETGHCIELHPTGQPQQNAHVQCYNRTVRHEWLDQHIIEGMEAAPNFATQWLSTYKNERPSMGIGGFMPAQKLK
jgi:hypothetical protein